MKLIWAFKFSKSKDPVTKRDRDYDLNDFVKVRLCPGFRSGRRSLLSRKFAQGILTGPNRFECEITPRSIDHTGVIKQEFLSATQTFEPFEQQLDPADEAFLSKLRGDVADELHQ